MFDSYTREITIGLQPAFLVAAAKEENVFASGVPMEIAENVRRFAQNSDAVFQ